MIRIGSRPQRTLARPATIRGVGMIIGTPVTLRLLPAPAHSGIQFRRSDLRSAAPIPAHAHAVTGTDRRTTLGSGANQVTLVEHVLSALAGMRIDNALVELDAPEPPGLDGSAQAFVEAIHQAGTAQLDAQRGIYAPTQPITVQHRGATLTLHPADAPGLKLTYFLDYGPRSPIPPQSHTLTLTPAAYERELARCRTFVLEQEAYLLQTQGVGLHLTHRELVIFGPRGPLHNTLRHPDEPARHKLLDVVGDLSLCGLELAGHLIAYRSGHPLNVELARTLSTAVAAAARGAHSPPASRRAA